jgi:hypothetical protein
MKILLLSCFLSLLIFSPSWGQSKGMHPTAQIKYVQKKIKAKEARYITAYESLLNLAHTASQHETHALEDFNVPGYYTDAEGHRKNSLALQSDAFDAYASALAYRLSGKKQYAQQSVRFLNAWAYKNKAYSNADGSLVMAYSGTALLMAADLLKDSKEWSSKDQSQFQEWSKNVYRTACNEIRTRANNWGDWGRLGSILTAVYLNDQQEINENIRLIKSDLFTKIADDSSMPHETKRGNNGIWYTYFSLAPITASMWVAYQATGENLFALQEGKRSVTAALDYLLYYNQHADEWPWFKGPNKGNPEKWPGALFEAMGDIYQNQSYTDYSSKGRPIVYNIHHFAWSFPTLMPALLTY